MALIEHLEKLRHFYRLTQYSSINEAAANTGYSQAGLSKSLQLLEKELNCKLFKRSREGLTLTRDGVELLEVTKKIIFEASQIENRLQSNKTSSVPKKLKFGMYDSIAVYFGVELKNYLKSIYPNVEMNLHADTSSSLYAKIVNSEIDIAVGVNFSMSTSPSTLYYKLFDDSYSYYVLQSFEDEIDTLPVLIHDRATDANGVNLSKILSKDLRGRNVHIINNFETLRVLTAQGFGIGVLPTQVALPHLIKKEFINVQLNQQRQLFGQHHIGFLVRKEVEKSYPDFISDLIRLGSSKMK